MKRKSPLKRCDELWSILIKKRANGECEKCGSKKAVQSHHIVPRTCYPLRHDMENGIALCKKHHLYWAHKDAVGFFNYIKDVRDLKYLERRRHSQSKNDYKLIEILLQAESKRLTEV